MSRDVIRASLISDRAALGSGGQRQQVGPTRAALARIPVCVSLHPGAGKSQKAKAKAESINGGPITFYEEGTSTRGDTGILEIKPELFGDVVIARKDVPTSYHLAVTADDAFQGVTLITRGQDLFPATYIHRILQILLGYPEPRYHHHGLIRDETGRRLSKSAKDMGLRELRAQGRTPADIRRMVGL